MSQPFTCISILTAELLFLQCLSSWSESTLFCHYAPVYRLYSTLCRRGRRFLTASATGSTLPCCPFHWKRYLTKNCISKIPFDNPTFWGKNVLKFFFSPALLNICSNDNSRLVTRLRRIRVKEGSCRIFTVRIARD